MLAELQAGAELGWAGQGREGQGRAGQGRAGQGRQQVIGGSRVVDDAQFQTEGFEMFMSCIIIMITSRLHHLSLCYTSFLPQRMSRYMNPGHSADYQMK
jgi:hypothetical protein